MPMPYEIPQELQYTERISFVLIFEQLAYAVIFLLAGLLQQPLQLQKCEKLIYHRYISMYYQYIIGDVVFNAGFDEE